MGALWGIFKRLDLLDERGCQLASAYLEFHETVAKFDLKSQEKDVEQFGERLKAINAEKLKIKDDLKALLLQPFDLATMETEKVHVVCEKTTMETEVETRVISKAFMEEEKIESKMLGGLDIMKESVVRLGALLKNVMEKPEDALRKAEEATIDAAAGRVMHDEEIKYERAYERYKEESDYHWIANNDLESRSGDVKFKLGSWQGKPAPVPPTKCTFEKCREVVNDVLKDVKNKNEVIVKAMNKWSSFTPKVLVTNLSGGGHGTTTTSRPEFIEVLIETIKT